MPSSPSSPASSAPERVDVLGVGVDPLTRGELLDRVAGLVRARASANVAYVNVHVLDQAAGDAELVRFLRAADVCYCDGAGVVLGARLLGQHLPERMTGADWIHDLADRAATEAWRIAWVGGTPGATEAAARELVAAHPGVAIVHTEPGYLRSDAASRAAVARINAARPDIVLVGMGTPVQERWVARWRASIDAPVVWCLGATHDFVSGRVSRGPAWLHERQEWLARLWVDPVRLGRRYLVGNPRFLARVLRQRWRGQG